MNLIVTDNTRDCTEAFHKCAQGWGTSWDTVEGALCRTGLGFIWLSLSLAVWLGQSVNFQNFSVFLCLCQVQLDSSVLKHQNNAIVKKLGRTKSCPSVT